ncbi:ATP-dependent DNA/RNA helicase DHX36-like [Anopheles albimanus]|uniref:ATP-dependent DNA/RNA helicase DHX36-like n=1 Tax=Anopheles albimanus TaxID=7167 RepID=UPI00163F4BB6|nr:ATP-dependent DNA/RNA helicase DHX36-like [Anopheles albimanus]
MIRKHRLLSEIDLVVHMLHSRLSGEEQRHVFAKPPLGTRKIILATNIAETSITIEDVVYVINTGRHMVNAVIGNACGLTDQWISKSNEVQRKGRAGRVQEGVCYHLYSRARMRTFAKNVSPEILGIVLDEVILQIKILRLGEVRSFMDRLMDKPSDEMIEASLQLLHRMNAIDDNQHLTLLASHLAQLRMHPTVGKMVLLASIFGCVDPITSIAASISYKDAFCKTSNTALEEDEIRTRKWLADHTASDHVMLANAITKWRSHGNRWWFCKRNALNSLTLHQLCKDKDLVTNHLYKKRFVASDDCQDPKNNSNATNMDLLKGIIAGGLFSNVARLTQSHGFAYHWCLGRKPVCMHHSSVNAKSFNTNLKLEQSRYMVFQNLINLKNNLTICTTTVVSPLALVFFGDNIHVELKSDEIMEFTIGDQFGFKCDLETYRLIEDLRQGFNELLTRKLTVPSPIDWSSTDGALICAIIELLSYDFETRNTEPKHSKIPKK